MNFHNTIVVIKHVLSLPKKPKMGSASQPMLVIKYNRALLKKRKLKDIKELMLENAGKTELEFKKVSPEEMTQIKARIREQHRRNVRHEIIIYIISAVLAFGIFYLLYSWIVS